LVWELCDGYVEEIDVVIDLFFDGKLDCGGYVIEFLE
jgi:hypothetical protein